MNARKIAEDIMRANWTPESPLFDRKIITRAALAIQQALIAARNEALDEAAEICDAAHEGFLYSADFYTLACAKAIRALKARGGKDAVSRSLED